MVDGALSAALFGRREILGRNNVRTGPVRTEVLF